MVVTTCGGVLVRSLSRYRPAMHETSTPIFDDVIPGTALLSLRSEISHLHTGVPVDLTTISISALLHIYTCDTPHGGRSRCRLTVTCGERVSAYVSATSEVRSAMCATRRASSFSNSEHLSAPPFTRIDNPLGAAYHDLVFDCSLTI